MAQKAETLITNGIIKWLQAQGGDAFHVHGSMYQRKGEPDIDGWISWSGRFLHLKIEVKTEKGKPDPLQLYRLKVYSRAGYVAGIVRSINQTRLLLNLHSDWLALGRNSSFNEYMERHYEDHFEIYSFKFGGW